MIQYRPGTKWTAHKINLLQRFIDSWSFGIYSTGVFWINFSNDTSASGNGGRNVSNADNRIAFLIGVPVLTIIISSYLSHISPVFLILVLSYVAMILSGIASNIAACMLLIPLGMSLLPGFLQHPLWFHNFFSAISCRNVIATSKFC